MIICSCSGTLGSSTAMTFWCVEMMETKGWDSDGWDFGDGGKSAAWSCAGREQGPEALLTKVS